MNEKYVNGLMKTIRSGLGSRKIRVRQSFGISQIQIDLAKRMEKINNIIYEIPNDKVVLVHCDYIHAFYLMKYTNLRSKNIKGFVNESKNEWKYTEDSEEFSEYKVYCLNKESLNNVDIVIAAFEEKEIEDTIERYKSIGFNGEIISLYDEIDDFPFFAYDNCIDKPFEKGNEIYKNIHNNIKEQLPKYAFEILDRIKKVNKALEKCGDSKILVYCTGGHTNMLFELTDIKYKNVVALADRDVRNFAGLEVRTTEKESFEDVDYIIISSYLYQNEIKDYLERLGFSQKVICLYDNDDLGPFYEQPNLHSPDKSIFGFSKYNIGITDVWKQMEDKCDELTRSSNYYLTYKIYDDYSIDSKMLKAKDENKIIEEKRYDLANSKTAIIIQGPIIYENDFTYHTIELYKLLFPKATIILSTWKEEKEKKEFEKFFKFNIEYVFSEPPSNSGLLNINYQIVSTNSGLKRAKALGIQYALKTRTDFRIYSEKCISHTYKLTELFKSKTSAIDRITILPPNLDIPYYIPDYIYYGNTDDLLEMWDDTELFSNDSSGLNPEMMITIRYLKRIGRWLENPTQNMGEFIDMLCNVFIIVDYSTFDCIWRKYTYNLGEYYRCRENLLNETDWLNRQF